jgi:hypothetical protein
LNRTSRGRRWTTATTNTMTTAGLLRVSKSRFYLWSACTSLVFVEY